MQIVGQEAVTVYYRRGKSVGQRTASSSGDGTTVLPDGAEEITHSAYLDAVAVLATARDEHRAEMREAASEASRADYEALITAGLPDASARRMSGHTPGEVT